MNNPSALVVRHDTASPALQRGIPSRAGRHWRRTAEWERELGREAILADYTVQFTTATTLVAGLAKAHGERRLGETARAGEAKAADHGRTGLPAAGARRDRTSFQL
ncbi:hypothetical protein [Bradyrhizobium vignae]|uniref:hypothetical protein n=1 Tax=Bradyrhizobium vignae TaxID=1549949 RepID=UPI0024BF6609|nr:hypothetical protein [Bradyrhizobium vignae]